jgi:hypothetical protein
MNDEPSKDKPRKSVSVDENKGTGHGVYGHPLKQVWWPQGRRIGGHRNKPAPDHPLRKMKFGFPTKKPEPK